jgi:hypothetical protein
MRKLSLLLALIMIFAVVGTGCSGSDADVASEDGAKKSNQFVTVLTGGSSGAYFALGGTLSNLLNEKLDYVNSSVESTGASAVNSTKIGNGEAEIAFAMNNVVSFAYEGVESFEEKGEFKNIRGITALYPNFCQVITLADTGITQIEDLEGKRVGVGAPGSGVEVDARNILKAHDITYDDIEEDYLSYAESVEQMKNGTIDAAFLTSGIPNSSIMDLATTQDVVIVTIRPEMVEKLQETIPYYSSEIIPAGTYDNEEDVYTAAVKTILVTREDLDEDTVYDITKTLFENLDAMRDTHNAANQINIEKYDEGMPVPMHPGALKYFEEVGVVK